MCSNKTVETDVLFDQCLSLITTPWTPNSGKRLVKTGHRDAKKCPVRVSG